MVSWKRITLNLLVVVAVIAAALGIAPVVQQQQPSDTVVTANGFASGAGQRPVDATSREGTTKAGATKPIDQPNFKDKQRMMERQRLLEAGLTAEAAALAQTGDDRVLILLVEYAGTDTFTWNPGDQWDPLGIADPAENAGTAGDCSKIITQTRTFTYTGPLHNAIARPLSAADRSGDTIWTQDFSKKWFDDFLFGNGVVISYTRQDNSVVHEDFTGQSVKQYYSDVSSGVYTITGDVVGWLQVPHSTWYYDGDQCPGARSGLSVSRGVIPGAGNARQLVRDTLDAVNAVSNTIPGFDWAHYDRDGDGIIDRLWVVHAGYGEEDATTLLNRNPTDPSDPTRTTPWPEAFYGEAAVWSHSSAVTPPYPVSPSIMASAYIVMPENGGIGVFAHEYGHNLGADDLYAYDLGETSAGFWTIMADDWVGFPIGFEPPAPDPWHLDRWGWLDPFVITDPTQVYTVTLGQASYFNTNTAPGTAYRAAKIELDDQIFTLSVPVWDGSYYWWGGKVDETNSAMTSQSAITLPNEAITLTFDTAYGIETEWDFLWVQVSADGGTTWDTITNTNTTCTHDPGWIGGLNGFPDDLCAAGLGGFTDYNASFPAPDTETFNLSAYAGQGVLLRFWYMTDWGTTYEGPFIDNVTVTSASGTVFADDAEAGDANWTYDAPWTRNPGFYPVSHNYYVQWRNTNPNGGYDSALGDSRWRYGPANTGLVMWYNNNAYTDNEVYHYLEDGPSFGPKGRMLVIDSHPDPYRDPNNPYPNAIANVPSRSQMRDATFTLQDTVDFTMTAGTGVVSTTHFAGRPAVSEFNDALGYYPGLERTLRGPVPCTTSQWYDKMWDASAVVPAKDLYSTKATGGLFTNAGIRMRGYANPAGLCQASWYGFWYAPFADDYNTGNPGDYNRQYGWHVQLVEEGPDHTWATVRIWNVPTYRAAVAPTKIYQPGEQLVDYTVEMRNEGAIAQTRVVTVTLDPALTFVSYSLTGGKFATPAQPVNGNAPRTWQVNLNAGETATLIVTAKTTVTPNQSGTLSTMVMQNDFFNAEVSDILTTLIQSHVVYLPLILR